MEIRITSRDEQVKMTDSLKETINLEVGRIQKFYDKITSAHVVLATEGVNKSVEIVINVLNHTVKGIGKAENIGKALDDAIGKVERQIKKLNEKLKDHKDHKSHDVHAPDQDREKIEE